MAPPKPPLPDVPPRPAVAPPHRRRSRDVIYEAMMRGGSAFGAPFVEGVASLTERVVKRLKQRGFFAFETFERAPSATAPDPSSRPNKFTRYGAGRFFGPYRRPPR